MRPNLEFLSNTFGLYEFSISALFLDSPAPVITHQDVLTNN